MEITSREVYAQMLKKIKELDFKNVYQKLRDAVAELDRYGAPSDLLASLGRSNPDYKEKDVCLYGLIIAARKQNEMSAAALTLLLITMWPSLVLIAARLRHLLKAESDPLAEVYWAFLQELSRPTYNRCWKIAANLSRNTAKRALETLRSEWRHQKTLQEIHEWASQSIMDPTDLLHRLSGRASEMSAEDQQVLIGATQRLVDTGRITSEEALLIIGHAIYGTPLKDLAVKHGIGHDTIRQRYCRLKAKLESTLASPGS